MSCIEDTVSEQTVWSSLALQSLHPFGVPEYFIFPSSALLASGLIFNFDLNILLTGGVPIHSSAYNQGFVKLSGNSGCYDLRSP